MLGSCQITNQVSEKLRTNLAGEMAQLYQKDMSVTPRKKDFFFSKSGLVARLYPVYFDHIQTHTHTHTHTPQFLLRFTTPPKHLSSNFML